MQGIAELDAEYYPNMSDPDVRFDRAIRRTSSRRIPFSTRGLAWVRSSDTTTRPGSSVRRRRPRRGCADESESRRGVRRRSRRLAVRRRDIRLRIFEVVLEDVEDPVAVFEELRRVLRPNGHLIFRVPSRFHYVSVAARLTPLRFHRWFNAQRGFGAENFPRSIESTTAPRFAILPAQPAMSFETWTSSRSSLRIWCFTRSRTAWASATSGWSIGSTCSRASDRTSSASSNRLVASGHLPLATPRSRCSRRRNLTLPTGDCPLHRGTLLRSAQPREERDQRKRGR